MLARRRFLTILAGSAAAVVCGARSNARNTVWQGRALGAQAEIRISGDEKPANLALKAALDTIRRMENLFSLYKPGSALNRLNETGSLNMPPEFARLIALSDHVHEFTGGLFDPTVQPLMAALARSPSGLSQAERRKLAELVGWRKVQRSGHEVHLSRPGMALTLNGIAQGFATDRVVEVLQSHGYEASLVHIGEYRAGTEPARIGIAGAANQILDETDLKKAAIATSAPFGTRFENGSGHIVRPDLSVSQPHWWSVTVQASSAALADGYSTAIALTSDRARVQEISSSQLIQSVWLEDRDGQVHRT